MQSQPFSPLKNAFGIEPHEALVALGAGEWISSCRANDEWGIENMGYGGAGIEPLQRPWGIY